MPRPSLLALSLLALVSASAAVGAATAAEVGIVLLPGKDSTSKPDSPVGNLAARLEGEGIRVSLPEVPWNRSRAFDTGYREALDEVAGAVAALRADGVAKVAVGGHSLGANVALGVAAVIGGVDGVAALAPGHVPDTWGDEHKFDGALDKARRMLAEGRGDETAAFDDINQGRRFERVTTARIYLSYWDPAGPAVMPNNAAALGGVPLFVAIGTRDRLYGSVETYLFGRAPEHPKNRLVEVEAGHKNTPLEAWRQLAEWLKGL